MNNINNNRFNLPIKTINKYVQKISVADTTQKLSCICSNITEEFEVSYYSCGIMCSDNFHHIKYLLLSDGDRDWTKKYSSDKYQIIDPRIKECAATLLPVSWNIDNRYLRKLSQEARNMMSKAYEHNIRSGVTIPFYSPLSISGVFSVGLNADSHIGTKSIKHLQSITPYVSYLGSYINQAMIKIQKIEKTRKKDPLTSREKDCLCWLADGKTASQTASKLFISESTVKFHCKNTMRKLGARNTAQVLAIAILRGYIRPFLGND